MKTQIAVVMVGENIFGRMLLEEFLQEGISPLVVINEAGSKRSKEFKMWLDNDFDLPRGFKDLVGRLGCKTITVPDVQGVSAVETLARVSPDYIINGGCGVLKKETLNMAKVGWLNVHPGLLPEFRGLDPVLWSLFCEKPVGATLHFLTEAIDEGPVLMQRQLSLQGKNVCSPTELRLLCMRLGTKMLAQFLKNPDLYPPTQQDETKACYFSAFPPENLSMLDAKLSLYNK